MAGVPERSDAVTREKSKSESHFHHHGNGLVGSATLSLSFGGASFLSDNTTSSIRGLGAKSALRTSAIKKSKA